MTKGRKPKPTQLKVLEGNRGKRALNKSEPKPTPTAPGCPTWLSNEGKAEWRRVVAELDRIGMLTKVDRAALATYCEMWSTFMSAQREVHAHGLVLLRQNLVTTSDDGQEIHVYVSPAKNPAVLIAKDAAAQLRAFAAEFGLTPSSRTRLSMPEPEDGDAFANLLS